MNTNNSSDRVTQHLRALAAGAPPGTRLPSVRELMRELRVSPVTVQQALERLRREGVLEARPGQGTFVAEIPAPAAAPADMAWQSIALGPGRAVADGLAALTALAPSRAHLLNIGYLPEDLQATALLGTAAARALRRPGVWGRMPLEGLAELRAWFAEATGGAYAAHEVTICPGTQPANAAAFRALAAAGDAVLVESPTYSGAIAAAQMAGLRVIPVPTDAEGVRPDLLEEAFRRSGARLFYCQPNCANPTGTVLSAARRPEVLDVVVRAGAFLIEDDWAHEFYFDGPQPPLLASAARDGHVVYVRSLTKCASPGLRIGAVCARGAALERLRMARLVDDFFVPGIMQETALQLVTAPAWPRHLRALRTSLRERRDLLAQAVRSRLGTESLPNVPPGGLHLWVQLPRGVSDLEVVRAAARRDVLVSAGRHWFPAEPPGTYLRLSFAAVEADWVGEAVQVLAEAIAASGA
ncbi:aminotransferase-like domain-containing protein [Rhodovastum atsumiense]|uniref:PLP-dependent aminotransferase family protein n=1 Tax=Rhodovastum atsumiense TaxID=504468 RepID=A0A5M6IR20_9PROT|nr:PLP-dependent aminotransferase family protein [Rhodovastum atsumiense]KAA5610631.1 PLP-dependent aminotransferase family protein [Rhodovastum atsumiense]